MNFLWHDWAGLIGVALVLLAFFLLQAHKLRGQGLVYQSMNLLGAAGVILSLVFGVFNLSAFLQELAWLLISLYGITRGVKSRREADVPRAL
jgi:paired small multidrug resistance pump